MSATTFSGGAIWWTLTNERQAWCNFQVKLWSMSEHFETKRCINVLYKYSSYPFSRPSALETKTVVRGLHPWNNLKLISMTEAMDCLSSCLTLVASGEAPNHNCSDVPQNPYITSKHAMSCTAKCRASLATYHQYLTRRQHRQNKCHCLLLQPPHQHTLYHACWQDSTDRW